MIPLAVHSHHSLMWGTAGWDSICRRAKRLGYRTLAMADTDTLAGLWEFTSACKRYGLRPIIGATVTGPRKPWQRAVCLVQNSSGYTNLCRLLTCRLGKAGFDLASDMANLADGLYVLTTDQDLLARLHSLGVGKITALTDRPLPASHRLRQTAARLGLPLAAGKETYFLNPGDHLLHRLLRAIECRTGIGRLQPGQAAGADAWLEGPQVWKQRFTALPGALTTCDLVAQQVEFQGPDFGLVMPPWNGSDPAACCRALRRAAYAGARRRYGTCLPTRVTTRLEQELKIIAQMKFCSYFLVVRDIVARSPRTCGRGSAAASLVAYCLGITNVCPLRHNLYFGRFLNPGRKDPPDIDVDFAWDERDMVIASVLEQFGNRAAMVSSRILFQPRMAIRETARVFGLTDGEIGRVTRRLPRFWRSFFKQSRLPEIIKNSACRQNPDLEPPWPRILSLATGLIGAPRHLAAHPGGVVITPADVCDYVPVQTAAKAVPIIQWDKDDAETAGLVKIDLLGNRSLAVIRDAVDGLRRNGKKLDEYRWCPEDDPDTRRAVASGRTMGCFYIESPAMRLLLQKADRGDFEHLVILSSIIRPAASEFVRQYLKRLHGSPWQPIHPLLEKVLAETFGVMVYQEDVSRVARALAGFGDAEADALRKVMAKKDRQRHLEDFRRRFFAGTARNKIPAKIAARIWEMMLSFSGYSFCKAHSASYARVSFQAAFLKVHHPAEFMAAVINNGGGFYSLPAYVSEARRMGLVINGPDVTRSAHGWSGRGKNLLAGLSAVKGLGVRTIDRILTSRRKAAFANLEDFLARCAPGRREALALADAGALDRLAPGQSRAVVAWHIARWFQDRGRKSGPLEMFAPVPTATVKAPPLPPDDPLDVFRRQYAVLGFLPHRHPLSFFRPCLQGLGTVAAADLDAHAGRRVKMAGWLITGKLVLTRKGDPMQFLSFEDETGLAETVFFPPVYRRFAHLLESNRPYLLTGLAKQDMGAICLEVEHIQPLARTTARMFPQPTTVAASTRVNSGAAAR